MYKTSIIIPVYNGEKTISRTIKSCLSQKNANFEIIIVDNGSTDRTEECINEFSSEKIRYIKTEKKGRSMARNLGIASSNGTYLLFLDADDCIDSMFLSNANKILEAKKNIKAYACSTLYSNCNGKEGVKLANKEYNKKLSIYNVFPINSLVIRNQNIKNFDEKIEYNEDWLFWFDNLFGHDVYIDQKYIGAIVYIHENSTMGAHSIMGQYEMYVRQLIKRRVEKTLSYYVQSYKFMFFYFCLSPKNQDILKVVKKNSFFTYYIMDILLKIPIIRKTLENKKKEAESQNPFLYPENRV